MGWTVWDSDPLGGENFRIRLDQPWDSFSLLLDVFLFFFLRRSVGHPLPSSTEVTEGKAVLYPGREHIVDFAV